jgi:hypothetical protein
LKEFRKKAEGLGAASTMVIVLALVGSFVASLKKTLADTTVRFY